MSTTILQGTSLQATMNETEREIWVAIDRSNLQQVSLSLVKSGTMPLSSEPHFGIGIVCNDENSTECDELVAEADISIAEARLLRDLLNHPSVAAILDKE